MLLTILWPFILKEWRFILSTALIAGLYGFVYHQGYESCKSEVDHEKERTTLEMQEKANNALKAIQEDNERQKEKVDQLQEALHVELTKQQYMDCVITPNGVRLLNKYNK